MRHPQLLAIESDGKLAALLRPLAQVNGWLLREPGVGECLEVLGRSAMAVLVVRIGRDLEQEFALVERVAWRFPETRIVLVGDSEHSRLVGLAWDLGAAHVHLPPASRERLLASVAGLMGVPYFAEEE